MKNHVADDLAAPPTVNVNLKPCTCVPPGASMKPRGRHHSACLGAPALMPLSLEPFRSVTFMVRPGECSCEPIHLWHGPDNNVRLHEAHHGGCPARPIRISCSISGKTWEESEVEDCEGSGGGTSFSDTPFSDACRERWALVKALVLGHSDLSAHLIGPSALDLLAQRDALYAALVKKACAEQADDATTRDLIKTLPSLRHRDVSESTASDYLSARALAHYVEHLIEHVGGLS